MSFNPGKALAGVFLALQILAPLSGCGPGVRDYSQPPQSQAELAAIRSRVFASADRQKTLRAVIESLQELGFVVDRADYALLSVSGVKGDQYLLRLTVTVLPQGADRLLVRANARYDATPVLDADPYARFFAALARALALEARPAD
ncbi:MAG TPA: hypothetical protein VGA73_06045 [Candidatus Binatia bacterium]